MSVLRGFESYRLRQIRGNDMTRFRLVEDTAELAAQVTETGRRMLDDMLSRYYTNMKAAQTESIVSRQNHYTIDGVKTLSIFDLDDD